MFSICVVYFLMSSFVFLSICVTLLLCACEDTIPFTVWGGCISRCFEYVFMYVLCEALLSIICVWICKPNEEKLSVN